MDRVYQADVSSVPPAAPFPGATGTAQGSPTLPNFTPTTPGPFWYFHVTESLRNVIIGAGLVPDPNNLTQFYAALRILASLDPAFELREDFSLELREDYSYEERE